MPSINNIDKFVQLLNSLGDEPNILKERGETLEPAKVPANEPEESNPFLVDIEDDKDTPDLAEELELISDSDDDLFNDDDLDLDVGAPELEVDDSFSLDIEDTELGQFDELKDIDDLELSSEPDILESLDISGEEQDEDSFNIGEEEELSSTESLDVEELDEASLDINDVEELSELSSEDLETSLESLDVEELDESSIDINDIEELSELSDEDLDTSPESLDDDLGITDIEFDDINITDDAEEEVDLSVNEELSIEDEVLQDDFGSFEDDETDEFSLGDFGDSFNFDKEASSTASVLDEFTEEALEEEEEQEEIRYSDEEFEAIKRTLFSLPLNLRIVIEEEIAENGLFGVKLEGLMHLLIDEAPLKEIVKYVNKILGKNIKISSSFMKLSALDLEAKKRTFTYILFNTVMPKLKWIFPVSVGASLLFLAGYFWGYKIIKSERIYKKGHELILVDRYEEAYSLFLEAFNTHRKLKWYYIYADTYYDRKAFNYAEDIYQKILSEDSSELRAVLSYSIMKGFDQAEYAKASNFLLSYVDRGYKEYDFMITLGDIYMKWAKVDPSKYENARLWYSETADRFSPKAEILFRFLNYLIETDKLDDVLRHRGMYETSDGLKVKVDGDTYARMANYLMDKGVVKDIRRTIFRGIKDNPKNPNLHYQLARYYKTTDNKREMEKALRNAIFYYGFGGNLSGEELTYLVDSKRMLGELYKEDERYLASQRNFKDSVTLYENLLDRNYVEKDQKFGHIYAGYGDIFYYAGNSPETAYNLYIKAEDNLYKTPELSYKKGFINYNSNNLKEALSDFHSAENIRDQRDSVLFAKANTLSKRGSYSSALTYYNRHIRRLDKLKDDIDTLYPRENDEHLAIIENYIRVYNNLGVTLYKLTGDKDLPEVGAAFAKSQEYYDYLTRDPDFLIRSGIKDLAYFNTRAILFPEKNSELFLYNRISKDISDLNIGLVQVVRGEE